MLKWVFFHIILSILKGIKKILCRCNAFWCWSWTATALDGRWCFQCLLEVSLRDVWHIDIFCLFVDDFFLFVFLVLNFNILSSGTCLYFCGKSGYGEKARIRWDTCWSWLPNGKITTRSKLLRLANYFICISIHENNVEIFYFKGCEIRCARRLHFLQQGVPHRLEICQKKLHDRILGPNILYTKNT